MSPRFTELADAADPCLVLASAPNESWQVSTPTPAATSPGIETGPTVGPVRRDNSCADASTDAAAGLLPTRGREHGGSRGRHVERRNSRRPAIPNDSCTRSSNASWSYSGHAFRAEASRPAPRGRASRVDRALLSVLRALCSRLRALLARSPRSAPLGGLEPPAFRLEGLQHRSRSTATGLVRLLDLTA